MLRDYIYGTEHSAPHCMCSLSESVLLCFFLLLLLLIAFGVPTHCLWGSYSRFFFLIKEMFCKHPTTY